MVAPAISTSASLEREAAVDAVPVKLPITFPVIAPMKLPDEIADLHFVRPAVGNEIQK